MATNPSLFAKNPQTDFTRDRKLSFDKLMHLLLGMRGNSINKELYDYFKDDALMTSSTFVQQRNKLLPEAMEYLLHEFNLQCNDTKTYEGYHLYAVDGTDVNIAKNSDSDSYNLFSTVSFFSSKSHIYLVTNFHINKKNKGGYKYEIKHYQNRSS